MDGSSGGGFGKLYEAGIAAAKGFGKKAAGAAQTVVRDVRQQVTGSAGPGGNPQQGQQPAPAEALGNLEKNAAQKTQPVDPFAKQSQLQAQKQLSPDVIAKQKSKEKSELSNVRQALAQQHQTTYYQPLEQKMQEIRMQRQQKDVQEEQVEEQEKEEELWQKKQKDDELKALSDRKKSTGELGKGSG